MVPSAEVGDAPRLRLERGGETVQLDDQDRLGIGGESRAVDRLLDCQDRAPVHHLQGRRDDSAPDDPADRVASVLQGGKGGEEGLDRLRERGEAQHRQGRHSERPFRPDEDPHQIVARAVGRAAP